MKQVQINQGSLKLFAQKPQQNISAGIQFETQTTSMILVPKINNRKNFENISQTEVADFSIPINFTLIPRITIALQVPRKTIRSNSGIRNDSNTSEKFTSQDNSCGATSHQFQFPN